MSNPENQIISEFVYTCTEVSVENPEEEAEKSSKKSKKRGREVVDLPDEFMEDVPPRKKVAGTLSSPWELGTNRGEARLAYIDQFKGVSSFSIREFYTAPDGQSKPGKKGISISWDQFTKLQKCWPKLCKAVDSVGNPNAPLESDPGSPVNGPAWKFGSTRAGERWAYVDSFRGKYLVSFREFYLADDGQLRPGSKGISLSLEQFQKLRESWDDICEVAERKLNK